MTTNHAQHLIDCEIQRHIALAVAARDPTVKGSHMEVLQALTMSKIALYPKKKGGDPYAQ